MTSGYKQPSSVNLDKIISQIESGLTKVYCRLEEKTCN